MEPFSEQKKRNVAYKLTIGEILQSKPVYGDEKLLFVELGDKKVMRVNILANCVDKFMSENQDKKYGSLTIDDASGQIRMKVFGDDVTIVDEVLQGDTLQIIGNIRIWNDELYITPEVVKKVDPRWLLVRKLEIAKMRKNLTLTNNENSKNNAPIKDEIMQKIKDAEVNGGIDIDALIMGTSASPDIINGEIKKLLEEGLIYEPRPGRIRYLG
jgi:RPA family protein